VKAIKFIVLAAGVLGVLAFFLPIAQASYSQDGTTATASLSAFDIVRGNIPVSVSKAGESTTMRTNLADHVETKGDVGAMKGIVIGMFAPGFLLLLIGLVNLKRGKFQRLGGFFTLLLGMVGLGIGMIFQAAADEVSKDAGQSIGGVGISLMLAGGALAALGGLLALIKPDRGEVAPTPALLAA
jgi:hypothetical protein